MLLVQFKNEQGARQIGVLGGAAQQLVRQMGVAGGAPVFALFGEDEREAAGETTGPQRVAQRAESGGQVTYRFDIHMQGPRETVFFDV